MLDQVPSISLLVLGKIIWLDVLLSGDNAVVIAAVCAGLPRSQRLAALIFGTVLAIGLRIGFTGSAAYLLTLTGLRLGGGIALLYIATKLLAPNGDGDDKDRSASTLIGAIMAVGIADISMSIDNVLAVAATANGSMVLLAIGLLCSIPLIMCVAGGITRLIERFTILIWAGAALLAWVAGELIASDPLIEASVYPGGMIKVGCASLVLLAGVIWNCAGHLKEKVVG